MWGNINFPIYDSTHKYATNVSESHACMPHVEYIFFADWIEQEFLSIDIFMINEINLIFKKRNNAQRMRWILTWEVADDYEE